MLRKFIGLLKVNPINSSNFRKISSMLLDSWVVLLSCFLLIICSKVEFSKETIKTQGDIIENHERTLKIKKADIEIYKDIINTQEDIIENRKTLKTKKTQQRWEFYKKTASLLTLESKLE